MVSSAADVESNCEDEKAVSCDEIAPSSDEESKGCEDAEADSWEEMVSSAEDAEDSTWSEEGSDSCDETTSSSDDAMNDSVESAADSCDEISSSSELDEEEEEEDSDSDSDAEAEPSLLTTSVTESEAVMGTDMPERRDSSFEVICTICITLSFTDASIRVLDTLSIPTSMGISSTIN